MQNNQGVNGVSDDNTEYIETFQMQVGDEVESEESGEEDGEEEGTESDLVRPAIGIQKCHISSCIVSCE